MSEEEIGKVSEFFSRPVVAGIDMSGSLKVGEKIHIKGHTTDLEMVIASMQIDNNVVNEAKKGDSVGVKVPDRVRPGIGTPHRNPRVHANQNARYRWRTMPWPKMLLP